MMGIFLTDKFWSESERDIEKLSGENSKKVLLFLLGAMKGYSKTDRNGYCSFGEMLQTGLIEYSGD